MNYKYYFYCTTLLIGFVCLWAFILPAYAVQVINGCIAGWVVGGWIGDVAHGWVNDETKN